MNKIFGEEIVGTTDINHEIFRYAELLGVRVEWLEAEMLKATWNNPVYLGSWCEPDNFGGYCETDVYFSLENSFEERGC